MGRAFFARLLKPIVDLRENESTGVLLMFVYSFLAMTAYNILKPITRGKFITSFGAENLPYVLLAAGILIGFIMQGYSKLVSLLPRRWIVPIAQIGMSGVLIAFWFLFQESSPWGSALFYLMGLILGILLISQFWTLANEIYDPRQAKRIFGFIGGGSSLGGITGSALLSFTVDRLGNNNLLLVSAALLIICSGIVVLVLRQSGPLELASITSTGEEGGVGGAEAFELLRKSKHLRVIAAVIAFAAIGASLIEQQLNMATEAFKGRDQTDQLAQFLGQVQLWTSIAGFVIQIWLTSRIHRYLGIGFALMILPVSLGSTALLMLINGALWTPALARVLDTSLRYTVDKTTREILFLPLPNDLKARAKPFVDVTVDRLGKATSALLALFLIAPWGLNLDWQQLSFASLAVTALWIYTANRAKQGYLQAFRQSLADHEVHSSSTRVNIDLSTIETLVGELADPDERRVLYAIDVLESMDKRNLITPLLAYHESPRVRTKALNAIVGMSEAALGRWRTHIRRLLTDEHPEVREAAVSAFASLADETRTDLARPYIDHENPRIASTAAVVLTRSTQAEDRDAASQALSRLVETGGSVARREVAKALRQTQDASLQSLLVPLLTDADPAVAEEAMRSVRAVKEANVLFVPGLVTLLRNRRLKSAARETLVSYGEAIVEPLEFFLRDQQEDIWVRRHIPATLSRIPVQKSMDALLRAVAVEQDGFLRYKLVTAIDKLRRDRPELTFDAKVFETLLRGESRRYYEYLALFYNLFEQRAYAKDTLLARALTDKIGRSRNRVFLLLGLIYPWKDIDAARWALEHGETRARASAVEYLDNLLSSPIRRLVMPLIEDEPVSDTVRRGNALLQTRPRGEEDTLLRLIHDDDEILAAAAIDFVGQMQMSMFVDDIEHILEHRDARDWHVFEAASWVMAGFRLGPERRHELWREPLPSTEVARRLIELPSLGRVSIDELFRFARTGRQLRHGTGHVLYHAGQIPMDLNLLLDGRVLATGSGGETRMINPPASLGIEEMLEGIPMRETLRATEPSASLVHTQEEANTLMADNSDLIQGFFQWILDHAAFQSSRLIVSGGPRPVAHDPLGTHADANAAAAAALVPAHGGASAQEDVDGDAGTRTVEIELPADAPLRPIDKILILQQLRLFTRLSATERFALGAVAREVRFSPDEVLFDTADLPVVFIMLDGVVVLSSPHGEPPVEARKGDAIGMFETLAGVPVGRRAVAAESGRALRIDHDDLFDLLAQRPALLQHVFTTLFRERRQ